MFFGGFFFLFLGDEDSRLCFCFFYVTEEAGRKYVRDMPWPPAAECNMITNKQTIRSVPFSFVTSNRQAYRVQHFNPTLLAPSISCFSPYLPVLASGGLSHQSVLGFPNQNPRLGSICGETTELEGREPILNAPPHLSRHPTGIRQKERFVVVVV